MDNDSILRLLQCITDEIDSSENGRRVKCVEEFIEQQDKALRDERTKVKHCEFELKRHGVEITRLTKELFELAEIGDRMRWVSVNNELPKEEGYYWGCDNSWLNDDIQFKTHWNNHSWTIDSNSVGAEMYKVTHWMPLMATPVDEN